MKSCADCLDLRQCATGVAGVVTCVLRTEQNAITVRRLAELGLRRGATVTAGRPTPGGGRVLAVAGAQLALDHTALTWLHVDPVGQS